MRLFISYARIDKPYCEQIVATLAVHTIWYDQRVHIGVHWWDQILEELKNCEGFVYLLSPESVKSEYCQKEFAIAQTLGKPIFPVVIHNRTPIPDILKDLPYVDLSKGLTPESVKALLNAIHIAERRRPTRQPVVPASALHAPLVDPQTAVIEAAEALEIGEYDRAVFLLKYAQASGYESKFIKVAKLLKQAEALLEQQAYLREADREYQPIAALVKRERTRKLGCKAFQAFREHFPDYDPENIAALCAEVMFPMLEWCSIPAGKVGMVYGDKTIVYMLEAFQISKYPVTNAQFQLFVDAPDGYNESRWWEFSPQAREWHKAHPKPLDPKFSWDDHPRANVCWYEAMAYCAWLSYKTGLRITLPSEQQWQRAAQGDDGRLYPWGNKFDPRRCNTNLSKIRMTTQVTRYENGLSPFGVYDMAGNVWEWCLNTEHDLTQNGKTGLVDADTQRAVRGGSFISSPQRAQATFHFYLNPVYLYATIGFRVVCIS